MSSLLEETSNIIQGTKLDNYIAVKVLRQFSDRISDALIYDPTDINTWVSIDEFGTKGKLPKTTSQTEKKQSDPSNKHGRSLKVIEEFAEKNGRNDTKFNILIIQNALKEVSKLSPLARIQIAWCYKMDYQFLRSDEDDDNDENGDNEILNQMTSKILDQLLSNVKSQNDLGPLKVDTSPKSIAASICKHLQNHASTQARREKYNHEQIDEKDPFSGPLDFTLSSTQANYIINVVEAIEGKEYYFGVVSKDTYQNDIGCKLNDHASKEVWMEPTDSQTGKDLNELGDDELKAPVSRAYYKLSQVFDEYAQSSYFPIPNNADIGCGMDVGSSPGGWTQVLHSETNVSKILSIDRALLARRVENLNGVLHCQKDFTSDSAIDDMVHLSPFSYIVCDASTNALEVFSKLISTFDNVHDKLMEEESSSSSSERKRFLTTPSNLVVTIKMPYNREPLKKKLLEDLDDELPSQVHAMMKWSNSKKAFYKIVHQMANSVTERTVIILLR